MMCQRIGRPPISTIGLGRNSVSSRSRVPFPPQRMTAFIVSLSFVVRATARTQVARAAFHGTSSGLPLPSLWTLWGIASNVIGYLRRGRGEEAEEKEEKEDEGARRRQPHPMVSSPA